MIKNPVTPNGGKRPDLDGLYVRSTWEANYCRYLRWLESIGQIAEWEYEPKVFEFPVKRGSKEYRPDFRVTNLDGSIEYHEVKGYMDQPSRTRLKRMRKYYPDVKVVLVDGPAYRAIARQMSRAIAGWE